MDIFLGKSKTGKSTFIYNKIKEDINNGKNVILFVPSQSRVLAEEEYIKFLNKDGVININITTIGIHVNENINKFNLNRNRKYISSLDRKIILTQVVSKNKDLFKLFSKAKDKSGFLDMLDIYIDLLRKNKYSAEDISSIEFKNKILSEKLKEISNVYEKYIDRVNSEFVDSVDEMSLFLNDLVKKDFYTNDTKIYFDGYNNFTKSEYEYINVLLKKNIELSFVITTDISKLEDIHLELSNDIFKISNVTYKKLLKLANDNKKEVYTKVFEKNYSTANNDLIRLINEMFPNTFLERKKTSENEVFSSIHVILEMNKYTEIQNIAKNINDKIKQGYRYRDFCLYTTDISEYENIVSKVFYEYNIPIYIDSSKSIETTKLTTYIIHLLEIAIKNNSASSIISLLKLGLSDFIIEDIYELENYILEFNINKYNFSREFVLNNSIKNSRQSTVYDLEKLNNLRIQINEFLNSITSSLKGKKTTKEIISKIYTHLNEYGIFKNYMLFTDELFDTEKILSVNENKNILESINDINFSNIESQVWDKNTEIFDSIEKIYGTEEITILEFYNVLKMVIKDINLKSIPQTSDQVSLLDINSSRTSMKKQVFFIGVNEDLFPKKVEQDMFFSDNELQKLDEKGFKLRETSLDKLNMQLFNIYSALNNVEEQLYIYIPSAKVNGKELRKSSLVTKIQNISCVSMIGNITKQDQDINSSLCYMSEILEKNSLSEMEVFENMVKCIKNISNFEFKLDEKNKDDIFKIYTLYMYFKDKSPYKEILEYEKKDDNLDKEALDIIYSTSFNTSISKLEAFKRCPFSYFIKYVLNIDEEKRYNVTSMDIGSFLHNVLEKFSLYLFENKVAWQAILLDENTLEVKEEKVLNEIIQKELNNSFKKHKENIRYYILEKKLTSTMKKVVISVAKGFNQSAFVPYGYEIEFREGAMFAPIKISLKDKDMYLVGKIDRIDVLNEDDKMYVRVVDYKSSQKNLSLEDIKEGISLQLITYISAFIENMKAQENKNHQNDIKDIIPSAMLYFNLSDNIVNLKEYTNDSKKIESEIIKKLRMRGIFLKDVEIIEKMDNKLNDTNKRLIDISSTSLKKDGKSSKALEEDEFKKLCEEIKSILQSIGEEVTSGFVKILPNKKINPCKYCKYLSICRKNSCV